MARISLASVSVSIPLGSATRSFREDLFRRRTGGTVEGKRNRYVRALQDVSLEIGEGERVGILGHNGAGKSTLLRVMAGIYRTDVGRVVVEGRISSLFTAGFILNSEETGLDNILVASLLLGIESSKLQEKVDEIATFSELGEYLNFPIRTYSSGMVMRLAFGIATAVTADILLLDEWLSAGDANFAKRAQERLGSVLAKSKILVFASHNEALLREFCDRGIVLDQGRVVADGHIEEALLAYRSTNPT